MANRYREWLELAEGLNTAKSPHLANVPADMFTDVHNALARLWSWQQRTHEAAREPGRGDARVAAELEAAIPRVVAVCYELDRWGMERATVTAVPGANALVATAKPPQHSPVLFWPADDGGIVAAVAGEDGDGLVIYGVARHIPGDLRLDERFFTALELAASQWELLVERDARAASDVESNRPLPAEETSVAMDTRREQRGSRWAVWLERVCASPPAELVAVIGDYPTDPALRAPWRHAALRIGRYHERYGEMPAVDMVGAARPVGEVDPGRPERLKIAEAVRGLQRATLDRGTGGPAMD